MIAVANQKGAVGKTTTVIGYKPGSPAAAAYRKLAEEVRIILR